MIAACVTAEVRFTDAQLEMTFNFVMAGAMVKKATESGETPDPAVLAEGMARSSGGVATGTAVMPFFMLQPFSSAGPLNSRLRRCRPFYTRAYANRPDHGPTPAPVTPPWKAACCSASPACATFWHRL